jgi:signal transduction histidine kinase
VLAVQIVSASLLLVATVRLARRADREDDEFLRWFAAGTAVGVLARVNYFLFPSRYSQWVYTGDLLRLVFHGLVLVGAVREIGRSQRAAARVAALDERRRLARDLHDGVAQELAFISSQSRVLAERAPDDPAVMRLAEASRRALEESRRAITALAREDDRPLAVAIAREAYDVAGRMGATVTLDVLDDLTVPAATRDALLRIVREAVANAARHSGDPAHVTVSLSRRRGGLRLVVADDGRGFEPAAGREGGFGLTSMRERARAVGAELVVRSRPGEGTRVELTLP